MNDGIERRLKLSQNGVGVCKRLFLFAATKLAFTKLFKK